MDRPPPSALRPWHRLRPTCIPRLLWLVLWTLVAALRGAESPSSEPQLKAALITSFAKFVEWPQGAFADAKSPFAIGVIAAEPLFAELQLLARNKKINGRDLHVRAVHSPSEASAVHMLFLGAPENQTARECLTQVRTLPVLTVGESDAFALAQGIITLVRETDKIRFEIDLHTCEINGLRISSQLQKLARRVSRSKP